MSLFNDKAILLTCFNITLFFYFRKKIKLALVDPTANNVRAILVHEPIGYSRLDVFDVHEKDEFI